MKLGSDAIKKMADLDNNAGLVDPKVKRQAEAAYKAQQNKPSTGYSAAPVDGALDDKSIAADMLTQAVRMHNEATGMINEAARMKKEAEKMFPGVRMMDLPKMAPMPVMEAEKPAVKKGRPAKAKVAAHAAE